MWVRVKVSSLESLTKMGGKSGFKFPPSSLGDLGSYFVAKTAPPSVHKREVLAGLSEPKVLLKSKKKKELWGGSKNNPKRTELAQ